MIMKNFTETVIEMIFEKWYWNDWLPLSAIFPACFIYLLIYWHLLGS